MISLRSGILTEAMNTMEMQWVAYDQVVCGSSDAVVIRRVVTSRHAKVKNFSQTSASPKQDSATRHHHPTLHSRKIIKLGFLPLPYWFLTESSQYQSCGFLPCRETISDCQNLKFTCHPLWSNLKALHTP